MPAKAAFRLNSGTVEDPRRRGVGVGIVAVGELVGLGLGAGLAGVAIGLVEVGSGLAGDVGSALGEGLGEGVGLGAGFTVTVAEAASSSEATPLPGVESTSF